MNNRSTIQKILKVTFLLLAVFLGQVQLSAQQNDVNFGAISPYLEQPEKMIEFVIHETEFWKQYIDSTNGGYDTDENSSTKSFCAQSRMGYAFSKAYALTGNQEYLDYANFALDFLYQYGWDKTNEGWYFAADSNGAVPITDGHWAQMFNDVKWSFQQHYALVGIASMLEITQATKHKEWFEKGLNSNYNNLWDDSEENYGYYAEANNDWGYKRGKGFTPTVDAMTTHAFAAYHLNETSENKMRLIQLANNCVNHLGASMDKDYVKVGFAEVYDSYWNLEYGNKGGSTGHVIKTAWCLARAYLITGDETYRDAARKMIMNIYETGGYDMENGGAFMGYNWGTGEYSHGKDYWMLEQALTGGLINYYISESGADKEIYLKIASESLDFFMKHFIDTVNGGSYSQTNNTGEVTKATKGDLFKAGYHAVEMAYFTYLYANIYLNNKPIQLYYSFEPGTPRTLKLTPLAINEDSLIIDNVLHNGVPFENYHARHREITLENGEGGEFLITFRKPHKDEFVDIASAKQNAPRLNVFPNPSTGIFNFSSDEKINTIKVYNNQGQLMTKTQSSLLNLAYLNKGFYVAVVTFSNGKQKVKQLIKN